MNTKRLYLTNLFFGFLPPTRCFALKASLLRWAGARVGKNVRIVSSAKFWLEGELSVGDNTWIGHDVLFVGGAAGISIGCDVDIAPRVTFVTGTHEAFGEKGRAAGKGYSVPICIEDGAWIGAAATILGDVTIGCCAIVAAGSLVRTNVRDGVVIAGVPAKEIGRAPEGFVS